MKNMTIGILISFGFGSALGITIYDYFVHENVDWIRSLLVGLFVTISLMVFNRLSTRRSKL
jgi:hypothetical protein